MSALRSAFVLVVAALALAPGSASADPSVPGFDVEVYAAVSLPMKLSFDDSGNLFVGHNVAYPDSGSIFRVAPGGFPSSYGTPQLDPDAVIAHRSGSLVPATEGAVLVGGVWGVGQGHVTQILLDETEQPLWTPSSAFENPQDFAYDSQGRLLFADYFTDEIHVSAGGTPVTLCSLPSAPSAIALDGTDRVFVWSSDGVIRIYDSAGALVDGSFASGLHDNIDLAFGPGGIWGTDLYTIANGELVRIDSNGSATVMGTGFSASSEGITGLAFGPDDALYASDYPLDRILRIVPSVVDVPTGPTSAVGSRLYQNAPNPFAPWTRIAFALDRENFAEVDVYDVAGRLVRRLHAAELGPGRHSVTWNGDDLSGRPVAAGTYFYQLRLGGVPVETRKALVRR